MRLVNLYDCIPIPYAYIQRSEPRFDCLVDIDLVSMPILAYRHPEMLGDTYFIARLKGTENYCVYRYNAEDNTVYTVPHTEVFTRKGGLGMLIRAIREQSR